MCKLSVTAINKFVNEIQLEALANLPLPMVREKTGSAELRMSRDTLFAMIWNETENDISTNGLCGTCSRRRVNVWYLCEVGVLRTGQDASEDGRTVETHHWRHH